ncbi:MAG: trypsin-like peptidase domain-containing protein [Actinomycetota bacterium]
MLVVGVTLAAGCGGDEPVEDAAPDRPPLASPPDPGPPPTDDGLADSLRADIVGSTMRISGIACGRTTEGSGFAVSDDLVATNAHVLIGLPNPTVEFADGSTVDGDVVAFDAVDDLALIRLADVDLAPLPLGSADDGTVGAVFGWEPGPEVDPTPFRIDRPVTVRIEAVASEDRIERRSWLLAAQIEAGDSGAALVDAAGTVVGVAYATTTRGSSVAYAVRAERLESLIADGFNANLAIPDC